MAVRQESESPDGGASFTVTNGDLNALAAIKAQYGLKDEASVIVFALGLLSQAGGRPVKVVKEDGTTVSLLPSDGLKPQL